MEKETIEVYINYLLLFLTFTLGSMALHHGLTLTLFNLSGLMLLIVSSVLVGSYASNRDRKRILKRLKE